MVKAPISPLVAVITPLMSASFAVSLPALFTLNKPLEEEIPFLSEGNA